MWILITVKFTYMSSVDSFVSPTQTASSFPSAITAWGSGTKPMTSPTNRSPPTHCHRTTTVSTGRGVSILAPGDVRPGHITLAPLRMNLIAPLSTCTLGSRSGSTKLWRAHNTMYISLIELYVLTLMKEFKGWEVVSITLLEEQQLSLHQYQLNVVTTTTHRYKKITAAKWLPIF